MQFSVAGDGGELRSEVCNENPNDDERLRERGWELCDSWSGVWRRTTAWPASSEKVAAEVDEATYVIRGLWGNPRPDSFGYLAWEEPAAAPAWQFWKSSQEKPLKFPKLGLSTAPEPDPNK